MCTNLARVGGVFAGLVLLASVGGCAAVSDDMRRAEQTYETARYENTLIWLEDLEHEAPGMDVEMRVRYYYLRGMTEFRLGHRADALHYLAVAREIAGDSGGGLRDDWRQIMDRTLTELTPQGMGWRPSAGAQAPEAEHSADEG